MKMFFEVPPRALLLISQVFRESFNMKIFLVNYTYVRYRVESNHLLCWWKEGGGGLKCYAENYGACMNKSHVRRETGWEQTEKLAESNP